jgi:sec-independent protein translocase protein TatA
MGKEAFVTNSLVPLIFNLGPTELLIILAIVLLLFGGARLAGLGKSTGRAIKEFKEETKGIRGNDDAENVTPPPAAPAPPASTYQQPPDSTSDTAPRDPR